ncbi:hypothetical protein QOZ80_8AG0616990 [Eleusine coracana subsp. coracana]|nr:hypothetical protein QOZ80_8AG0616990 [Eleusine coracana subsp. coracana]
MTRAAMTFVFAVLVSLATMFVSGNACNNVPTMGWVDACHKACDGQPWFNVCTDTLKNAPESAEVTVFTIIAARLAKSKYEDTMAAIDHALAGGELPAGEKRAAVESCKAKYAQARGSMVSVADQLFACDLSRAKQELADAKAAVEACKNGVWWASQGSSPLFPMVSANLDLTMVASDVGALVVGK